MAVELRLLRSAALVVLSMVVIALSATVSSNRAMALDASATGRGLLELCHSTVPEDRSECGYLISAYSKVMLRFADDPKSCVFRPTEPNDYPSWVAVTIKYLETHPDDAYNLAYGLCIMKALRDAYPCSN
jgi:hypothetical protein